MRLVDADALVCEIKRYKNIYESNILNADIAQGLSMACDSAIDLVEQAKTADATAVVQEKWNNIQGTLFEALGIDDYVPVVHASWDAIDKFVPVIEFEDEEESRFSGRYKKVGCQICSHCKQEALVNNRGWVGFEYCPHCGAKMDRISSV